MHNILPQLSMRFFQKNRFLLHYTKHPFSPAIIMSPHCPAGKPVSCVSIMASNTIPVSFLHSATAVLFFTEFY